MYWIHCIGALLGTAALFAITIYLENLLISYLLNGVFQLLKTPPVSGIGNEALAVYRRGLAITLRTRYGDQKLVNRIAAATRILVLISGGICMLIGLYLFALAVWSIWSNEGYEILLAWGLPISIGIGQVFYWGLGAACWVITGMWPGLPGVALVLADKIDKAAAALVAT